jgi:hypothetical protein
VIQLGRSLRDLGDWNDFTPVPVSGCTLPFFARFDQGIGKALPHNFQIC